MRKVSFAVDEIYHIYNRGTDKRNIFLDFYDVQRFIQTLTLFNTVEPIGSLYEITRLNDKPLAPKDEPLVEIICYCLNPNHYHLMLKQVYENGISNFIKRVAGGYSWYFNNKYKRTGSLFGGPFKAIHIDSNDYLLRCSSYINLNPRVHQFGDQVAKLTKSSWEEYINGEKGGICKKDIILGQFKNLEEYKNFAEEALEDVLKNKELSRELEFGDQVAKLIE